MPPPTLPLTRSRYKTPANATTFFGRTFPTLCFYLKLVWLVLSHGLAAKQNRYTGADWAMGSVLTLRALEESGVQVHAEGIENFLDLDGPCIFISNHMSSLETFVLPCFIQPYRELTFVIKKELVQYPIFSEVIKSRDPVTVGRKNPREDLAAVFDGGLTRIQNGRSIIVFPQSTRSSQFQPENFNSIGIKLAKKAQVPVVPVALVTTAWGMGNRIKEFGPINPALPVHIAFGKPLHITGSGKQEHAQVVNFIEQKIISWNL